MSAEDKLGVGGDLNLCSDASNSSWEDVEDEETETGGECGGVMNAATSLLMNSLILERIFEYLPIQELQKSRLVCREWNKTALLRRLIGSQVEIKITTENFDKLLRIAQNSLQPFCRKFDFHLIELDICKVSKFIKLFGERINSLSIRCCSASPIESVIKLLNCPRLEELTVFGALPPITKDVNFQGFLFSRLKVLSLSSSVDYGLVNREFIRIVLKRAPNLQRIKIGYSISLWNEFCSEVSLATSPKLCQIEFKEFETPLQKDYFECFLSKQLILRKIYLRSCFVSQDFMEQLLLLAHKHLVELHITGTQQEIISKAFSAVTLLNIREISLPIDAIGFTEGNYIINSCPRLRMLKVTGLFQTIFEFQEDALDSVSIKEIYSPMSFSNAISQEKQREFLKVLSLINMQPIKLIVNLPELGSICLRSIYIKYPKLEELCLDHSLLKEFIVGLTGIPYRIYRRIAHCKSISVLSPNRLCLLPSISKLKDLRRLKLSLCGDTANAELTLILFVYGICELSNLKELSLNNFKVSDVSLMTLVQKLHLSVCKINGSNEHWKQFQSCYKQHAIRSFLLPPPTEPNTQDASPANSVGMNSRLLVKMFARMHSTDIFEARKVCKYWHSISSEYLHQSCQNDNLTLELEKRLNQYAGDKSCPPSPINRALSNLRRKQIPKLAKVLQQWSSISKEVTLAVVTLDKSTLDRFQLDSTQNKGTLACQQRKMLEYWYYPDGCDEIVYRPALRSGAQIDLTTLNEPQNHWTDITTLLAIGCWGRKDDGLLEFLNPKLNLSTIHLIGLQKEALDIVLPKLTQMINLESLYIKPTIHTTTYCELTKTHLQILCNASFNLKNLAMQLHAPSEAVVDFVKSQRFSLETLELHSLVNISDRLTFSIPHLRILQLDEPPGCLLWTTLNIHSSLETISFGRNGSTNNQVKNKSSPKMNPMESDFEHSATAILCDVNWFLENANCINGIKVRKSILQQGSDSALKFFTHFPHLSSLTLRGVHAHYGILQGIFRKFPQLMKLELINATGVTDEILTGFPKEILDEMDVMNPFQVSRERHRTELRRKGVTSIRNLKSLTHLVLDNQPCCTDFAVIFGLLKLSQLQFLSCSKWKISDISIRALADILPSLKEINIDDCGHVSKYAVEYFKESRIKHRLMMTDLVP